MRKSTRFSLAMLLTLVMWVCVPLFGWVGQAYAVNPTEGESEAPVIHVSNLDELRQQLSYCNGQTKTIVLDSDIEINRNNIDFFQGFEVSSDSHVVLDMNGHSINYQIISLGDLLFQIYNSEFTLQNGSIESLVPCVYGSSSTIYLENVRLKGLYSAINARSNSKIEIKGNKNVLTATDYMGISCAISLTESSSFSILGECELHSEAKQSTGICCDRSSSVNLPYEYAFTDKDGGKLKYTGDLFLQHDLYVKKNLTLPELCNEGEHVFQKSPAVEASCTTYGIEEYYYCTKCNRRFSSSDASSLMANSYPSFTFPLGHLYLGGDGVCQKENCGHSMQTVNMGFNSGLHLDVAYDARQATWFKFVAPTSGRYNIRSAHQLPTDGALYDKDFNYVMTASQSEANNGDCTFSCDLVEGETYYITMFLLIPTKLEDASLYISSGNDSYLLQDGDNIHLSDPTTYESLIYKRTFTEDEVGKWQAHVVPFEIPYEVWKDEYEAATPLNFHEYSDENGKVIKRELEVVKVENANLPANYPLLVRVKSAGEKTFTMNQVTLKPTEIPYVGSCASMSFIYTFFPLYRTISEEGSSAGFYVNDGKLKRMEDGVGITIRAQRWYLSVHYSGGLWDGDANPNTNPFLDDSFDEIGIRLVNEDGPSTAVRDIQVVNTTINSKESSAQSGIYDLNGCRQNTLKKGVNIVRQSDGSVRKVMIK